MNREELINADAKKQYIEMWKARRTLYLLDIITDAQNHSILKKFGAFRKKHKFEVTLDELNQL